MPAVVARPTTTGDEIASPTWRPVADDNDFRDFDALTQFPSEDGTSSPIAPPRVTRAVPPPASSAVDALLEAVSEAGRSPILLFRSEADAAADALAPSAVRESAALARWRPAIVRWVVPSAAAFVIGALSVLWALQTQTPVSRTDFARVAAPRQSAESPAVPPSQPLVAASAPSVEPPRRQPVDPPRLAVAAGVTPSIVERFPQTRISLPTISVAKVAVASSPAGRALPRTPSPLPSLVPPAVATTSKPLPPQPSPPLVAAAVPPTRHTTPPSMARRLDSPPLTPLSKLEVRGEGLTVPPAALPPLPTVAADVTPAVARADGAAEEYAVRRALHSYEEAAEDLDVAATANVWPTVDRGALSRAFATLKSQGLDFRTCSITVNDSRAVAECRGTLQFVRKVGNSIPLTSEQQWIFKMRRFGADWKIDAVSASPASTVAAQRVRGQG